MRQDRTSARLATAWIIRRTSDLIHMPLASWKFWFTGVATCLGAPPRYRHRRHASILIIHDLTRCIHPKRQTYIGRHLAFGHGRVGTRVCSVCLGIDLTWFETEKRSGYFLPLSGSNMTYSLSDAGTIFWLNMAQLDWPHLEPSLCMLFLGRQSEWKTWESVGISRSVLFRLIRSSCCFCLYIWIHLVDHVHSTYYSKNSRFSFSTLQPRISFAPCQLCEWCGLLARWHTYEHGGQCHQPSWRWALALKHFAIFCLCICMYLCISRALCTDECMQIHVRHCKTVRPSVHFFVTVCGQGMGIDGWCEKILPPSSAPHYV